MPDDAWHKKVAPILSQLQIIVAALVTGCLFFLGVSLFVATRMDAMGGPPVVSYTAVASAVMALAARMTIPGLILSAGRRKILHAQTDAVGRGDPLDHSPAVAGLLRLLPTATITACAIIEGATFFLLIAYLIEQWLPALFVAVAMIVILALHIPTRSRTVHWIEHQLALLQREKQLGI